MKSYTILETRDTPTESTDWRDPFWAPAEALDIDHFHDRSGEHRPVTRVRALHDNRRVYVLFHVNDRFVRYSHRNYMDRVCEDSCVEWFVAPRRGKGYFNFEINCGGTLHCSYIENPERTTDGFKKWTPLPLQWGSQVRIDTSFNAVEGADLSDPIEWSLSFSVPFSLFEHYVGKLDSTWMGNFFKCADKSSHPHWAAWAPISELNFHNPNDFAELRLG